MEYSDHVIPAIAGVMWSFCFTWKAIKIQNKMKNSLDRLWRGRYNIKVLCAWRGVRAA